MTQSVNINLSNWQISDAQYSLPRGDANQFIGYSERNDSIIIFGGDHWTGNSRGRAMVRYTLDPFNVIDYGEIVLDIQIQAFGQSYVRHSNTLYFTSSMVSQYILYGMDLLSISTNIITFTYPGRIPDYACLTTVSMLNDYLFSIGGAMPAATNELSIYDITDGVWIRTDSLSNTMPPHMNETRMWSACNSMDQKLFAIAGDALSSVEILDVSVGIDNIINTTWQLMSQSLPVPLRNPRTVEYGTNILVFGGIDNNLNYNSYIYCIDTINHQISTVGVLPGMVNGWSGLSTIYGIWGAPVILQYPKIHIFGGWNENDITRSHKYHVLKLREYEFFHSYTTPINVWPSDAFKKIRTINIRSTINLTAYNVSYYTKFNIIDEPCNNPIITVWFQGGDFFGDDKFLNIFYREQMIGRCGSYMYNQSCNNYHYCLNDYPLGNTSHSIGAGEQIIIKLEKGINSGILSDCTYSMYSLWADVILECGRTPNPTSDPTSEPTSEPTIEPTMNPTLNPSSPTIEPTTDPTPFYGVIIAKTDVFCPDGFEEAPFDDNLCIQCGENEAGLNGLCEECGDGKEPNEDHSECILCEECIDESVDDDPSLSGDEDYILPIIVVVCVCFIILIIIVYKIKSKNKKKFNNDENTAGTELMQINEYDGWNNQQSLEWILSLGNGRYSKYKNLRQLRGFRGVFFKHIDLEYIEQEWDINGDDADLLLTEIKKLINLNENKGPSALIKLKSLSEEMMDVNVNPIINKNDSEILYDVVDDGHETKENDAMIQLKPLTDTDEDDADHDDEGRMDGNAIINDNDSEILYDVIDDEDDGNKTHQVIDANQMINTQDSEALYGVNDTGYNTTNGVNDTRYNTTKEVNEENITPMINKINTNDSEHLYNVITNGHGTTGNHSTKTGNDV